MFGGVYSADMIRNREKPQAFATTAHEHFLFWEHWASFFIPIVGKCECFHFLACLHGSLISDYFR